MHFTNILTFQ